MESFDASRLCKLGNRWLGSVLTMGNLRTMIPLESQRNVYVVEGKRPLCKQHVIVQISHANNVIYKSTMTCEVKPK